MKWIEVSRKEEGVIKKIYILLNRITSIEQGNNEANPIEGYNRATIVNCENEYFGCDQTIDEVRARMEAAE